MTLPAAHDFQPSRGLAPGDHRTRAERVEQNIDLVFAAAFSRVGNLEFARRAAHRAFVEALQRCARTRPAPEFEAVLAVVLSEQTDWPSVQLSGAVPHRPVPGRTLDESPAEESKASPGGDTEGHRGLTRTRGVRLHRALCEALASLSPKDRGVAALVFVQAKSEDRTATLLAIPRREVEESVQRAIERIQSGAREGGPDLWGMLGGSEGGSSRADDRERVRSTVVERLRLYRLGPEFVEGVLRNTLRRIVLE